MTGKLTTASALLALFAIQACLTFGGGAASAQEVGSYAHVQTGALNLRAAPDSRSSVLRALPYGASVSILDRHEGWARVFVQGAEGSAMEGWVAARFLGQGARAGTERRRPIFRGGHGIRPGHQNQTHKSVAPLRVSKLDFDCRPALFGNSGIKNVSLALACNWLRRNSNRTAATTYSLPVAEKFPTARIRDVVHNARSRLKGTVSRATTDWGNRCK
ncbi:SH3 domain-containing protein [Falsihalocynthiibacter arcticus]|uniref:SH3b domain-containing protein n=1 Tax=Falsihalocynthiibacter arcticus TaxID=1579316 RepID=A0A126V093_9RHOB|nr:SH3 domain-containing protein [Falsihalocynthiibacter arcticus]AML51710.1 hypothetical protein RC74_10950 [Falsihalocynthiibacter arcticus]